MILTNFQTKIFCNTQHTYTLLFITIDNRVKSVHDTHNTNKVAAGLTPYSHSVHNDPSDSLATQHGAVSMHRHRVYGELPFYMPDQLVARPGPPSAPSAQLSHPSPAEEGVQSELQIHGHYLCTEHHFADPHLRKQGRRAQTLQRTPRETQSPGCNSVVHLGGAK